MQHLSFAIGEETTEHHGVAAAAAAARQRRDNRLPEPCVHCFPEHGHPPHANDDVPSGTRPAAIGPDKRISEGERRLVKRVEAGGRVAQGEQGATELSARLLAVELQQVRTVAHVLVPPQPVPIGTQPRSSTLPSSATCRSRREQRREWLELPTAAGSANSQPPACRTRRRAARHEMHLEPKHAGDSTLNIGRAARPREGVLKRTRIGRRANYGSF